MERLPYRYKPFSAPEHLHLLKPGDHGTSLDEGEYSELFINKVGSSIVMLDVGSTVRLLTSVLRLPPFPSSPK